MKKTLLLFIIATFLLTGAMLFAKNDTNTTAPDEEYDEETYGPAEPIIWVKPVRSVIFDHKIHTMGAELECDSCHDELFEMEAGVAEENDDFTMASLYEGQYCGACHDGETAFASDTRCTTCHIGVRGHMRLTGEGKKSGHSH